MNFWSKPRVLHKNPASKGAIALTFDDGPCLTSTPAVMDILKEHAIPATFFMIGERIRRYPELARAVLNDGHQIANHSDRHVFYDSLFLVVCIKEIKKAEQTFRSVTGVVPKFYRPPKGLINRFVVSALSDRGYNVSTWSRMPGDYFWWHSPFRILKNLSKVRPGDVVVLHDGLNLQVEPERKRTLKILPPFINETKKKGIRFVTIADLFGLQPYF